MVLFSGITPAEDDSGDDLIRTGLGTGRLDCLDFWRLGYKSFFHLEAGRVWDEIWEIRVMRQEAGGGSADGVRGHWLGVVCKT